MFSVDEIYQLLGGSGGTGEGVSYGLTDKNDIEALFMTSNHHAC